MTILSKLLNAEWSVPYNCYEVGHFWTPHCSDAALELMFVAFGESLKIYTPLYLASQILFARKYHAAAFTESAKSILRSSAFLSTNAFAILLFFCECRHGTGKFYYRIHSFWPTFAAALMSITIEKPSRRFPLAIYVANIASECLFRIAVDNGYIRSIPKGEVILFTLSISSLLYLIKRDGYGQDPVSLVLRYYLGRSEAAVRSKSINVSREQRDWGSSILLPKPRRQSPTLLDSNFNVKPKSSARYPLPFPSLLGLRHASCTHEEPSCVSYAAAGFFKPFLAAWLGSAAFACIKKYNRLLADPSMIGKMLFSEQSVSAALFFGTFSAVYKAANCLLRFHSDGTRDWHALAAGVAAGPAMLFRPNATITLYVLWKLVETLYWKGEKAGYCKHPILTANILYSAAVAQIAYCLLLQPKHIRPSYMRFIDQLTGHRFHTINRLPLNVLVPDAVQGYEDFFPNLNPQLMSKKFMESMFVWLI